jgi:hypothetical protein
MKAEPSSSAADGAEEEDEAQPLDEKQLVYSTMQGVRMLPQPSILKAELHEHQVTSCDAVPFTDAFAF